jgi:hypothetical protein
MRGPFSLSRADRQLPITFLRRQPGRKSLIVQFGLDVVCDQLEEDRRRDFIPFRQDLEAVTLLAFYFPAEGHGVDKGAPCASMICHARHLTLGIGLSGARHAEGVELLSAREVDECRCHVFDDQRAVGGEERVASLAPDRFGLVVSDVTDLDQVVQG